MTTSESPPETKATGWLKTRKAPPPETPSGRSRRRLFVVARIVVIAAVAYSVLRVVGVDVPASLIFAVGLAIAFASRWLD